MQKPLISVLIPTYNVASFVEKAVKSIQEQTYSNLEIIIVDDCSADETYNILLKLAAEDDRIKLFRNDKNSKIAETLNFAITKATGKYFARMDGDDISLPQRLEKQFNYLIEQNLDLVGLDVLFVDEEENDIHIERYMSKVDKIKDVMEYASPVPHFWLCKREVYDEVGSYRIAPAEDYDFIFRAIEKGFAVSNLPEVEYLQRVRHGNTATSSGLIQRKTIRYVKQLHKERVKSPNQPDSYTPADLARFTQSSKFEKYTFSLAAKYHHKYFTTKASNKVSALLYFSVAIMLSPGYKLEEIYNRFKIKQLKKYTA